MLMTPQQLEHQDEFSKTCSRNLGKLNIRFSQIYLIKKTLQTRMGKERDDLIDGLPYKKGSTIIEISGAIKAEHVKPLYRRVAFRLPVYRKC